MSASSGLQRHLQIPPMYNLLQTVFAATRPAQTFFKQSNGEDEVLLFIPAALAVVSALLLFLHVLSSIHTSKRSADIILRNVCEARLSLQTVDSYLNGCH
jgi:hypothetical protein